MNVRFTLDALAHIDAIDSYIRARSPQAAERIVKRIFVEADRLSDFSQIGHAGVVPGTYEWAVTYFPYIIVYEIDADQDEAVVIGVFHGARDR